MEYPVILIICFNLHILFEILEPQSDHNSSPLNPLYGTIRLTYVAMFRFWADTAR